MKSLELKGNVGDKVLIEATITGIRIEEGGVTYCVQTEPDADIVELRDSEVRELSESKEEEPKPKKRAGRPKKSEAAAEKPKEEPDLEKASGVIKVGRPKKRATVQSTLAKYEAMKAAEEDKEDAD